MFRLATIADIPRLKDIFRETVLQLAPSLYSPEQVTAWSLTPDDDRRFTQSILDAHTYLLINNNIIIGFSGLQEDGHIASFYVAPDYTRQGYGTKLLNYVLETATHKQIPRLYTEASFFSYPVFLRCGFTVINMETVNYNNVLFQRYKMEKRTST
jgi:putative acetyltransferase